MKTKFIFLTALIIGISSCDKWHYGNDGDENPIDNEVDPNAIIVDEGASSEMDKITLSPNEVIVSYDGVSDQRKTEIRDSVSTEYPGLEILKCDCGSDDIEMWQFDPATPDVEVLIEGVVDRLPRRSPRNRIEGQQSFIVSLPVMPSYTAQGQSGGEPDLIAPIDGSTVNIAILDTGVDYFRPEIVSSSRNVLYPSSAYSDCISTQSGWNFIEGNQDILDENGHGTYVTKIITDILDAEDDPVNYQILPLKVFDASGNGSYWNILCALAYVKSINENGGNIDIVNASFGGAVDREYFSSGNNIYAHLLGELNDLGVLVVTSAGNEGRDNDNGTEGHFLSSYRSKNMLSVAGYNDVDDNTYEPKLHEKSNFGIESVQVAMAFNGYEISLGDASGSSQTILLDGTSYSAAAMTALAAITHRETGLVSESLKSQILNLPIVTSSSELDGKIEESRVIVRE
ncbi:S8 family serine peptidase [Cytophaga sp. FL35]|uniref:S8 family serine peptidase n=1 Tax=Cytophaga sp. FL35 TaxID=1904456 RepID=UPI001653D473|nr:S8 family serine peptidase [Cytophaga sp. FL35]MBC6999487.1 S8 family serine peptidase [Cytophaga sp. FL35]